jgi:hypothetical protein
MNFRGRNVSCTYFFQADSLAVAAPWLLEKAKGCMSMPSRGYWLHRGWISRAVRRSASLLIATFCISAAAQQVRVSGSVRDSTGAVIPGAAVNVAFAAFHANYEKRLPWRICVRGGERFIRNSPSCCTRLYPSPTEVVCRFKYVAADICVAKLVSQRTYCGIGDA